MVRKAFREARKDLGKSQRELADDVGLTENSIRQIENGRQNPSAKHLLKLSISLKKPAEVLFSDLL